MHIVGDIFNRDGVLLEKDYFGNPRGGGEGVRAKRLTGRGGNPQGGGGGWHRIPFPLPTLFFRVGDKRG